jgi:ABC-type sugar transport system ATPase subunit
VATPNVSDTSEGELANWIVGDAASVQQSKAADIRPRAESSNTVLSVRDLALTQGLEPISFELFAGEILGFAGLDGSGKERAMKALFGLYPNADGEIRMQGQTIRINSPRAAFAHGVAYLAKHRESEMIVQNLSVEENTLLSGYARFVNRAGFIKGFDARRTAGRLTADTGVKTRSLATPIDLLSGGNKQKALINRLALVEPRVFLLNEPTRGVDIASKPVLLAAIRNQLSARTSVIMTSESEEEMISICDRILVFFRGRVVATLQRGASNFTVDHLYKTIQGVKA